MKNMVLQFQYFAILLFLTIAFSSCSQLPDLVIAEGLDYEIPNETIQADQYLHPDFTESYKRNEALTEFSDDGQLIYYTDEKGRLIHVRGDGSELMMDPVNIEK